MLSTPNRDAEVENGLVDTAGRDPVEQAERVALLCMHHLGETGWGGSSAWGSATAQRGEVGGGELRREGRYIYRERYLWLIHTVVWQNPMQYCKAIILQLKI